MAIFTQLAHGVPAPAPLWVQGQLCCSARFLRWHAHLRACALRASAMHRRVVLCCCRWSVTTLWEGGRLCLIGCVLATRVVVRTTSLYQPALASATHRRPTTLLLVKTKRPCHHCRRRRDASLLRSLAPSRPWTDVPRRAFRIILASRRAALALARLAAALCMPMPMRSCGLPPAAAGAHGFNAFACIALGWPGLQLQTRSQTEAVPYRPGVTFRY